MKKFLIVYATQHGCTEKCAMKLRQQLNGDVELINLKQRKPDALESYETIIIAGSIHAGQIQKQVKKFCEEHLDELLKVELGLFLCCMYDGEIAQQQFQNAFPKQLIAHAKATGIFGGEFDFEKMNFFEKAIIKKIAKVEQSISKIDEQSIQSFSRKIQA